MSGIPGVNRAAAESIALGNEQVISQLVTGLGLIHVLQVYTACMVSVAVWDWLTCLKMEWDYIWTKEWSIIKGLYIWTRYYSLVAFAVNLWLFQSNFSQEECKTLHYLIAAMCMWSTLGSEAILAVRTYAFLGKQRWLGALLAATLLGEMAFLLYVSVAGVSQIPPIPIGDATGPCTASDKPGQHVVSGYWLAPVAFDLICTFLTLWKAMKLQRLVKSSRVVKIFIREGLGYFLCVCAVNVLNAAFMFQSNPNLQNINSFLALILSQVLCCRLVLNLKGAQEPAKNLSSSDQQSFTPHARSGVSIPLRKYRDPAATDFSQNEIYDGVKVQVDIERHDNEDQRSSTEIQHKASPSALQGGQAV
ncbi:hypothetical protein D9611_004569 [Ephemerocybe angulata]|uniref:Uncharacterized protein n=2 Tax=Ephemerocybe angulata TaxID=980116 RepID=A0A8H6IJN2_9AGAR|nr:hypothetical protein D9611_004569 [Tulosesus angulatus]KAF6765076.1 hypothetical protein DFP72DRAFT_870031 [Tulosesus angulatus]